jgi:hypothetical protein
MKSSSSIKITKYPKALDPNNILQKKIEEKYGVCPFCGGDKNAKGVLGVGVVTSISTSYHKNKEHSFFQRLFENHSNGQLRDTGVLNVMPVGKVQNIRSLKTESMIYGGRQALKAKKTIEVPYVERLWGEHSAAMR